MRVNRLDFSRRSFWRVDRSQVILEPTFPFRGVAKSLLVTVRN